MPYELMKFDVSKLVLFTELGDITYDEYDDILDEISLLLTLDLLCGLDRVETSLFDIGEFADVMIFF
jgi:hypothetical protein